jgi:addiction module HigA family antidote
VTKHKMDNIRLGENLLKEFLIPRKISIAQLAKGTGISQDDIHKIIQGELSIDADAARAIGDFLGIDSALWINLHEASQDEKKGVSNSSRQDSTES